MIIPLLLVAGAIVYAGVAARIASGIHTRYRRRTDQPDISIVIPARNEEKTICALLESLLDIDYPQEKLEIIVINDQSTDRTREVAESFRDRFRCRFGLFDVVPEAGSELRAKTRPLAQGIERAQSEFVLMPDADNRIPRGWAKAMTSYFTDDVGMVCGTILPDPSRGSGRWLTAFETLDAALLLGTCAGFSGLGKTQALIGSNFAVRRSAYLEVGTYRAIQFHQIEDLSLMRALQETGKWKAVFPADPEALLLTLPDESLADLIQQRQRWMAGWSRVKPGMRAALTAAIAAHVIWPLLVLASPLWFLIFYGLLVLGDSLVAAKTLARFGRVRLTPLLPLYPVFAAIYAVPLLMMMAFRRKVKWKERTF